MELDKSLVKEIEKDLRRDKVLTLLRAYRKHITYILISVGIGLGIYLGYSLYIQNKADKNSVVFSEVKEAMSSGDMLKAIVLLDSLIENGTNGYVFVSYLEKTNILMAQGKVLEALETLKEASSKISLPDYYEQMLKSLELLNRMNNNEAEDLTKLASDMKANLNEKDPFYFHNLEMYGATLFILKQYDESMAIYIKIIDAEKVSADVKERAKRAKAILISLK